MTSYAFIGGSPKSGTTWLQMMLNAHPDIVCRGELHLCNVLGLGIRNAVSMHTQYINGFIADIHKPGVALDADELLVRAIDMVMQRLLAQSGKTDPKWIIDKTPANVWHVDWLLDSFPGSRFIYVMRDPRDAALSTWKSNVTHQPEKVKAGYRDMDHFVLEAMDKWHQHATAMWERLCDPDVKDRIDLVVYEDMDTWLTLDHLLDCLDVDRMPSREIVAEHSFSSLTGRERGTEDPQSPFRAGRIGEWRKHFSDRLAGQIARQYGQTMALYGYDAD